MTSLRNHKMVVPGSEAAGANSPMWTIEYWSNLSNLVGVFILGAAVPVVGRILKKWEKMREDKKKNIDKHAMELITGVTSPMEKRLEKMEATLSKVDKFTEDFEEFLKEQRKINERVKLIDEVFQDNIRFGHNDNSGNNQSDFDPRRRPDGYDYSKSNTRNKRNKMDRGYTE